MIETWKSIAGYEELYEVSDLGRVRSLPRRARTPKGDWYWTKRHILSPGSVSTGYLGVGLYCEGIGKSVLVHRLVLEAFVGPAPDGMQCCHLDGNRRNNRVDNLMWGTPRENQSHRKIHGTDPVGERNPFAKLTAFKARWIRRLYATGEFHPCELAEAFEVAHSTINGVVHGRTWNHVDNAQTLENRSAKYIPTPEQIAAECEAIRATWSPHEHKERLRWDWRILHVGEPQPNRAHVRNGSTLNRT